MLGHAPSHCDDSPADSQASQTAGELPGFVPKLDPLTVDATPCTPEDDTDPIEGSANADADDKTTQAAAAAQVTLLQLDIMFSDNPKADSIEKSRIERVRLPKRFEAFRKTTVV